MRKPSRLQLPRWKTPEFYLYYIILAVAVPWIISAAWDVSQESSPGYDQIQLRLSPGWLFGRQMDNSDQQYAGFRQNLNLLVYVMLGYLPVSWWVKSATGVRGWLRFSQAFSVIFLVVAHGYHALKIAAILVCNYAIARICGGSVLNPLLTWTFNIALLFTIDWTRGFKSWNLHDTYAGIMRWDITFNITVLRLISFNMDYYWAKTQSPVKLIEQHGPCRGDGDSPHCCAKMRAALPRPIQDYTFFHYLCYAAYIPLYFAGPIMPFNAWMAQISAPSRPHNARPRNVAFYAARWAGCVLLMEVMMHTLYVVARAKARAFEALSPFQVVMVGYWNLKYIWLKLLIIWRFFRTWALADGVDPPENMRRCMTNNYSVMAFWRDWHASYNLWNVRYLYVPLGGARWQHFNIWVIFTFVAIWHDIKLRLLAWGWLICIFMVPELLAQRVFGKYHSRPWFRPLKALGAVFNIGMMITANLVGFAVGVDGIQQMLSRAGGVSLVVSATVVLFALANVQFEVRAEEQRRQWAHILGPAGYAKLRSQVSGEDGISMRDLTSDPEVLLDVSATMPAGSDGAKQRFVPQSSSYDL